MAAWSWVSLTAGLQRSNQRLGSLLVKSAAAAAAAYHHGDGARAVRAGLSNGTYLLTLSALGVGGYRRLLLSVSEYRAVAEGRVARGDRPRR